MEYRSCLNFKGTCDTYVGFVCVMVLLSMLCQCIVDNNISFFRTLSYLSTFENFPGVESARQLVSDILPIARGRYK